MTAQDNLNGHQFRMPLSEVMKLPSIDAINEKRMPGHTVEDILPAKESDLSLDVWNRDHGTPEIHRGNKLADTMDSMAREGQRTPVHIFTAGRQAYGVKIPAKYRGQQMLGNGGHRVAIAKQLGWQEIAWTPNKWDSHTGQDT